MWARCKMPNHIHAPTTVQRNGQGLILMWISGPLFSKLTFCSDVFIRLQTTLERRRRKVKRTCGLFGNNFVIADDNLHCFHKSSPE